jgi:hypothetical protein
MSRKRQLTPRQQEYANAIIAAGLAEREEVEDAFRERSVENESKISSWGIMLARKRADEQKATLRRLQTEESCAYPGCSKTILVKRFHSGDPGHPRPTRWVTMTVLMEGWHWKGLTQAENTKTVTTYLWGCPEHQESLFHLEFSLTPTLVKEQERPIQYPMTDKEQWRVYELARKRAQELVAQASESTDLPHIRRTIMPLAEKDVEGLIAASDPARLTDNLEQFRTVYTVEFVEGWLEGLRIRRRPSSWRPGR